VVAFAGVAGAMEGWIDGFVRAVSPRAWVARSVLYATGWDLVGAEKLMPETVVPIVYGKMLETG